MLPVTGAPLGRGVDDAVLLDEALEPTWHASLAVSAGWAGGRLDRPPAEGGGSLLRGWEIVAGEERHPPFFDIGPLLLETKDARKYPVGLRHKHIYIHQSSTMAAVSASSSDQTRSSSEIFQNARFDAAANAASGITAPTASQLLGDAAALHPLAGLNTSDLDYLSLDDGKLNELEGGQTVLPSRGWGDELCYGTGTTYLVGESASSSS